MAHFVETPNGPARTGTSSKGAARTGLSVPVRLAQIFYAVLASIFVVCVLIQVFFAGMGAFGADWSYHVGFVHLLEPLPLLMVPVAFLGRMPWVSRLLPLALVVLIGAQYALAHAAVPAAALHPANALLIFLVGLFVSWRAWSTVDGKR